MTRNRATKHHYVPDGKKGRKTAAPGELFKRGNYSMLRLLLIVNAAGPEGIPTRKLLDEIGSHATYIQRVIDRADDEGLITRQEGLESGPGHFKPWINIITDKGRDLLLSQLG